MYKSSCLGDPLNLRSFITTITEHIRDNGTTANKPRSIISFLNIVMKDIPLADVKTENEKEKVTILLIQKVLAGSASYVRLKTCAKIICDGKWDVQLTSNLNQVRDTILDIPNPDILFDKLSMQMSLRFFDLHERARLRILCEDKEYSAFLLGLLKHGFATLYNLPAFASERLYNEAQTVDYDNPRRYGILKNAAELGHVAAALEVGNYYTKRGTSAEAFYYLSLALPSQAAVWNITFMLENGQLTPEQIRQFYAAMDIEQKLSADIPRSSLNKLEAVVFEDNDEKKRAVFEYVYKVYFWLAYTDFFKGFNSLYKLLSSSNVTVKAPYTKDALKQEYLQRAISSGEITSASNRSCDLLNQYLASTPENPMDSEQEAYFLELVQVCSDRGELRGPFNMGRYLTHRRECFEDTSVTYESIKEAYEMAQRLDADHKGVRGYLPYNLAQVLEKITGDGQAYRKKKIELYDDALRKGLDFAAYDKAKHLFLAYMDSKGKEIHLLYEAQQTLEIHMSKLEKTSGETKRKAEELLRKIQLLTGI